MTTKVDLLALDSQTAAGTVEGELGFRSDKDELELFYYNDPIIAGRLDKLDATGNPTVNDDANDGYTVGSLWVDVTNDIAWIAVDVTAAAAIWTPVAFEPKVINLTSETTVTSTTNVSIGSVALDVAGTYRVHVSAGARLDGAGGLWILPTKAALTELDTLSNTNAGQFSRSQRDTRATVARTYDGAFLSTDVIHIAARVSSGDTGYLHSATLIANLVGM